jgi:type IV fimbrial biogenesis protein FimT
MAHLRTPHDAAKLAGWPRPPRLLRAWHRLRGMTLIEVAIVLAVLALLATLAAPGFAEMSARHRLKAAAEHLAADLQEARLRASERGEMHFVEFHLGSPQESCWTVASAAPCDCRLQQACRLKPTRLMDYPGVFLLEHLPAAFGPEGGGGGSALLGNSHGQQLRVEVSPLGRARVCSPGGVDPRAAAC